MSKKWFEVTREEMEKRVFRVFSESAEGAVRMATPFDPKKDMGDTLEENVNAEIKTSYAVREER